MVTQLDKYLPSFATVSSNQLILGEDSCMGFPDILLKVKTLHWHPLTASVRKTLSLCI
jgi:hypothetical protein